MRLYSGTIARVCHMAGYCSPHKWQSQAREWGRVLCRMWHSKELNHVTPVPGKSQQPLITLSTWWGSKEGKITQSPRGLSWSPIWVKNASTCFGLKWESQFICSFNYRVLTLEGNSILFDLGKFCLTNFCFTFRLQLSFFLSCTMNGWEQKIRFLKLWNDCKQAVKLKNKIQKQQQMDLRSGQEKRAEIQIMPGGQPL